MTDYIALLRKDGDSEFGVDFPDFPGCVTAGATLEEAQRLAREALALHVRGMTEDGEPIPAPMSLDAVMADPDHRDGVAILVPWPEPRDPAVRVNITLPESTLKAIDDYAAKKGFTRSGLLGRAAMDFVRGQRS